MRRILSKKKFIIIHLLIILLVSNFLITYAYWASSVYGDSQYTNQSLAIGDWLEGSQIWDTDDFITMITTASNSGDYSLAVDLDFQNTTPASWTQTKDNIFSGTLDCGGHTLSNISLLDYRGIFGVLEGATIKNCVLDSVSINYTTNDSYTTGLLAGRMQGTGNLLENITILNSNMSNTNVLSGALIGYASPTSGTGEAIIKDITVENTTVSGGYSNATYGNGGLIATVNNFDLTMENVNVQVDVTSTSETNVGGLIGSVIGSTVLNINGATIDQSNLTTLGTGTTLGAGGAIGLMLGTGHSLSNIDITQTEITSSSLSGGLIGYANQASATLELDQIDISTTNVTSSISDVSSGAGGMIGVINGYTVGMTNISVSADVTASGNANAGGISAVVTTSSLLDLDGVTITGSNISIEGTGNTLGAGGMIGLLYGNNHIFNNLDVINSQITSASISGGIIGYANEASSSITLDIVDITGSTISTSISDVTLGAGGIIGVINGYTVGISNANIEADITSSSDSNVGGITAVVTSTGILNLDTVSVNSSTVTLLGTNAALGAGGFIGLLNGTGHLFTNIEVINSDIISASLSGGVIGYADQSAGTLTIQNAEVSGSNITTTVTGLTTGVGGIIASVNNYLVDLSNILVTSVISTTGDGNAGGVIGFVDSLATLDIENITVYQSDINTDGTNVAVGGGGVIGLLYGINHQFTEIRVTDTIVNSDSAAGGVIGRSEQQNTTATLNNISIVGSEIYSYITSGTSGVGGIVGRTRYTAFVMNDIYIESLISGYKTNAAGLVGFSRYGDFTVNRAVIYSDLIITDAGTLGSRGAAGLIGRNRDGAGSSINDVLITGYFQARVATNVTYAGILRAIDTDLIYTNVRSAEISYYLASNPNTLVTSSTLYNNMNGQNPDYASTYTALRSSLDTTYWTTYFASIANSSLWEYNATTHLYQLVI